MTRTTKLLEQFHGGRLPAVSVDAFQPHSDLTFKVVDNLTLDNANAHQSLLNGSLFRNCKFRGVRFSRCDLEQVQVQNCSFTDTSFENVELTSAQIARSQFGGCNFDSALISDCVWSHCTFENCSFQQAVIHTSQFEQCALVRNNLRGASFQLDIFRKCAFDGMKLGDCTFLNHIMAECSYKDVRINAESIGSLFGISEQDLLSCKLVYLGHEVVDVAGAGGLLDSLENDYVRRRWVFMREVLRLNFGRIPRVIALDACLEALLWPSSLGVPLKVSDITFLEMIVLELFQRRKLPAMTTLIFPERIRNLPQQNATEIAENTGRLRLQQLANRLQGLLLELLEQLTKDTESLIGKDFPVKVTLVFAKKPEIDVAKFIRTVSDVMGLRLRGTTRKLREQSGSFLLCLQTTLVSLAAFQTALWLLNGCVAQVIELKARVRIATRKHPPKIIQKRVLLADQSIPKWMAVAVQGIFAKLTANPAHLKQLATDFCSNNVEQIEIGERPPRGRGNASAGES